MKKIYTLVFAALCAAVVLSCNKETLVETTADEQPAPVAQTILNPVTLTFETPSPSKVSINDQGVASWDEGDEVKIICFNAEGQAWTSDPVTVVDGKITATVEDADVYYAVYPASATIALENVGGVDNLKVTIATEQDGTFKNACYYAAKTTKTAKTFDFKAISGILKFQADPAYKRADIRDVEKTATRHAFAQTETCTFDVEGNVTITPVANNSSMIKITLDGNGTYYAAICGNAVNEAGFRFSKYTEEEDLGYEPGVFYNNLITYAPTKIKNFGKLTDKIVTDVYVSPEGAGTKDGRSAANAAPASDLVEACLGNTEVSYTAVKGLLNYTGVWNCFRLDGLTIHFAEGEYTNDFKVQGNNSSFELTLQGEEGTVLKGANIVSATRVPSETERGTLTTLKGFTFTNTNTSATTSDNIALTIATGRCNVEGCTFKGCTTRAAQIGGSSATDETLQVNFKNCLFSADTVSSMGAVVVPKNSTGGIAGFNNCRFENNIATNGNASAIYVNNNTDYTGGKTAVFLNKCSFIGNKCTATNNAYTIGTNSYESRFAMNCCTVNAGTPAAYGNGASLTLKGASIIVNSTVWLSSTNQFGKWGLIALGGHITKCDANDAAIINSVIRQGGTTYPAVYLNTNYYQNLNYCLHSGKDLAVESGKHTVNNTVKVSTFASAAAITNKVVDGITAYAYKWNYANTIGESGFTKPTADQVRAAVAATGETSTGAADGIGGLFLSWLDSVDATAFSKDITGQARPAEGLCPGSYQN